MGKNTKLALVLAGLVVLGAVGFVFLRPKCPEAEATVVSMFEAMKAGDVEAMKGLTCGEASHALDLGLRMMDEESYSAHLVKTFKDMEYTIVSSKRDGDNATVKTEFTTLGKAESTTYYLTKTDEGWKINRGD